MSALSSGDDPFRSQYRSPQNNYHLKCVLFGHEQVGKKTWLESLKKKCESQETFNVTDDMMVQSYNMKSACGQIFTFDIWIRDEKKEATWIGGLEEGFIVGSDAVICMFDLSFPETFWRQFEFHKRLKLYPEVYVLMISNNSDPEAHHYLPPEFPYTQISVKNTAEALKPLTMIAQKIFDDLTIEFV